MNNINFKLSKRELIVLAPAWPNLTGGYGIAIRSSLLLYLECFEKVHFICVTDEPFNDTASWPCSRVEWTHIPITTRAMWMRFLQSLLRVHPAITVRYASAHREVIRTVQHIISKSITSPCLIFEDIPIACFLSDIAKKFPDMTLAIRSHDMTVKAYGPLGLVGSPIHRMAWRFETIKIRHFEKDVCERVDKVWAISQNDVKEYDKCLSIKTDGVIDICMDIERYQNVAQGDIKTVVNVGTADLRKGKGLMNFIQYVWPKVRAQIPKARFVLAGRNTEIFTDEANGIKGLGFINDDRFILEKGLIFVNPQIIGAGVQLKSIVAMLAGKALVSTPICTEGIKGKNGQHFIIAESNEEMISQIVSLMRDAKRTRLIGQQAKELAARTYNPSRFINENKHLLNAFLLKTPKKKR